MIAATLSVYYTTLSFDFTNFDDTLLIHKNEKFLAEPGNILNAFTTDVFPAKKENDIFYRPLLTISFLSDYQLWGLQPKGYHLTNILLHAVAVVMFFLLIFQLVKQVATAFLSSLIFAIHPLLATAVAFIPGRNDSMLSIFIFGAFFFLIRFAERKRTWDAILHLIALTLALFSKESAVVVIPLFVIYIYFFQKALLKGKAFRALPAAWVLLLAAFFSLRKIALASPPDISFHPIKSFADNWFSIPDIAGKFFTLQDLKLIPIVPDMATWVGIAGLIILATLVAISNNRKMALFGLAWFVAFLLPPILFTNPAINYNYHYEHRTHTALLGIFILLISVFEGRHFPRVAKYILASALIAYFALTIWTGREHMATVKNEKTYLRTVTQQSPHCSIGWANYASLMYRENNFGEAETALKNAIEYNPENPDLYTTLAKIYLRQNKVSLAEETLNRLHNSPEVDSFAKFTNLSRFFIEIRDFGNAKTYLEKARELAPESRRVKILEQQLDQFLK